MAIDRSTLLFRKAPYWFAVALSAALLQFLWLAPVPSVMATAAVSGVAVALIHYFATRIRRDAAFFLTLLIMVAPGVSVTSNQPEWSILMYASVFFTVVTAFYTVLFAIERVKKRM